MLVCFLVENNILSKQQLDASLPKTIKHKISSIKHPKKNYAELFEQSVKILGV